MVGDKLNPWSEDYCGPNIESSRHMACPIPARAYSWGLGGARELEVGM
jgi:hypothetical protein